VLPVYQQTHASEVAVKIHKRWKLLAVAAALTGMSLNVNAGVLAQSVLEITNFRFLNPDGSIISVGQFDFLAFQDSSQVTASLNGTTATQTINSTAFGTLDLPQQCVGNCAGFPENDYSHRLLATVNVARGDSLLQGAPILNPVAPSPADAHVVAEAQLIGGGNGNVQGNLGLTASFSFSLTNSQAVTVSLDSLSHLIASISASSNGTARASDQWVIEVADAAGNTVFSWAPNGLPGGITGGVEIVDTCNLQRTVNAQLPGQTNLFDCAGTHSATTGILDAAQTFTLGLRHQNNADATQIPEPGTVLLMGLAFAGLGFGAYRRKSA